MFRWWDICYPFQNEVQWVVQWVVQWFTVLVIVDISTVCEHDIYLQSNVV